MPAAGKRAPIGSIIAASVGRLLDVRAKDFGGHFTDTDEEWGAGSKRGPMASMQGLRSVFGAVVALADDRSLRMWETLEPHWASLLAEWENDVLGVVEAGGQLSAPYDYDNVLEKILREGLSKNDPTPPYVDSASWALSTAILVGYTVRLHDREVGKETDARFLRRTEEAVIKLLESLVASQCSDGGWSWARATERRGTLYYTWSAIEGFADYYDYVAGESEKDLGIPADTELLRLMEELAPGLPERVDTARKKASEFLASRFLEKSIAKGLEWSDVADGDRLGPPPGASTFPLVYFDLYLLEALILAAFDVPDGRVSAPNRDLLSRLYRTLPSRYDRCREQLGRPEYLDLEKAAALSTMQLNLYATEKLRGKPQEHPVRDPGLWPQFLRTMVLYRFYTNPSADADPIILSDEDSALEMSLEDRSEASDEARREGLWDRTAFNLALTARSIEGLIDAYDYQNRQTRRSEPVPTASGPDLASMLAEALLPHLASKLTTNQVPQPEPVAPMTGSDDYVTKAKLGQHVVTLLGDALMSLPEDIGIKKEEVVARLLGKMRERELAAHNPEAHKLLGGLAWLCVCVVSRLLEVIAEEAVAAVFSNDPKNLARLRARNEELSGKHRGLADRFGLALKEVSEAELRASDAKAEPPDFANLVATLLGKPAGRAKKE